MNNKSLRILFDYSFEENDLFEEMKKNENPHGDAIVLFSKSNELFVEYFKQSFPKFHAVISAQYDKCIP